ncbi:MAG: hypothetical protein MUF87_18095 [Anaerolineae bacterium]|jgi:hypothetical protein|nr:hypothetical protein [Anaerolineae bacterium]
MSDDAAFRANLMEGISKFQGARARAFWQEMLSHLRGKSAELLSFEDIRTRLRLREESYKGLQEVPLDQIKGSVGRYRDFTGNFLPRTNKMQERWSRVYAQAHSMTGLPPIELYKIGEVYFVRDGNHRVSVARQMGIPTIEAHVTELPTAVELRADMTAEELDGATAYAAFLEETELPKTRYHHQPINLSESSRYADLTGHIYTHKYLMEQTEKREIGVSEAAADWYDNIYRPAITLIRKYKVLDLVPGRTEADMYLWLVDHLSELREQYGEHSPARKFSHALVDFLEDRGLDVPEELTYEKDQTVEISRSYIDKALREVRETDESEPDDSL